MVHVQGLWKGNLSAEYLYLTYGAVQFYTFNESGRVIGAVVSKCVGGMGKQALRGTCGMEEWGSVYEGEAFQDQGKGRGGNGGSKVERRWEGMAAEEG